MIFFVVSLAASIVGAICGIGGGVVIKPVLDILEIESVSTITFLSGCTILSMTFYSVSKSVLAKDNRVDLRTGTPLAIGAAIGGIIGKELFNIVEACFEYGDRVGSVQAICLVLITAGTLVYTLNKEHIHTKKFRAPAICLCIGLFLGVMSSFLGIGGGQINLVVLYYFFSMETKTAAANSLYIILLSKITSLVSTILTGSIPDFDVEVLIFMVAGGLLGGVIGRRVNRLMDNAAVDRLFAGVMAVIIVISTCNVVKYWS